jgi:hypothetical protein
MSRLRWLGFFLTGWVMAWAGGAASVASQVSASTQPVQVGSQRQLFVDTALIEQSRGLRFVVNPPIKAGCVLAPEKEWEECRIFISQVLKDGDEYKMWYHPMPATRSSRGQKIACGHCGRQVPDTTVVCRHCGYCVSEAVQREFFGLYAYAISTDGIHWERPVLRIREFRGSRENNLVDSPGPMLVDPKPCDGLRYLAIQGEMAPSLVGSTGGLRFQTLAAKCTPFCCDTANQLLWDPNIERYVAYLRGFPGRRIVVRTEMDDPRRTPWPHQPGVDLSKIGGETYITTQMPTVLDGKDFGIGEIYNPCMHIYPNEKGGVYLAFPTVYRRYRPLKDRPRHRYNQLANDGAAEIWVFASRDGKHFTLPAKTAYVSPGTETEPDCGYVQMGVGLIEAGDEVWQYYTGQQGTHARVRPDRDRHLGGVFRLVQKRDRFIGVRADEQGGELTTPLFVFKGARLELNMDCGGMGEAWVEIQDQKGRPIPGFAMSDFNTIDLNQLRAPCTWRENADLSKLAGQAIHLHIRLCSATLYAFRFSER